MATKCIIPFRDIIYLQLYALIMIFDCKKIFYEVMHSFFTTIT